MSCDEFRGSSKKFLTYKDSGVNIDAGNRVVEQIKRLAAGTHIRGVLSQIGGFSGLFSLDDYKLKAPLLVAAADGVGTKLKIAFQVNKHDTVGIDLVAMNVNDLVTCGARPLFFLDYIATSKLDPEVIVRIVEGITNGCKLSGCALLGGETAELPDFYREGEYDLAGFVVGIVDKEKLLGPKLVTPGDVLVGIASSGLHSNGYSLVRKILLTQCQHDLDYVFPELGRPLWQELLEPTRIYVKPVLTLAENELLKAAAHITGGGLLENLPRALADGCCALVYEGSWDVPAIFDLIEREGPVERTEMYRTFNMGIGMVLIVRCGTEEKVLASLRNLGERAFTIGEVVEGEKGIRIVK